MDGEAIHLEPIWRDRSDFIIGARLAEAGRTEQLWARKIDDRHFQICCIPFFLYDVNLGDIVEIDDEFTIVRVTEDAGRFVFRVWFNDSSTARDDLIETLDRLGALVEWSSANYLAVDAKDKALAQSVSAILLDLENRGHVQYETGRTH